MQACREIQYDSPDEAIVYAKAARTTAKKLKDAAKELHALRMIGICLYAKHDFEGAHEIFEQALAKYRTRKDQSGVARALQNVGLSLRGLGRNEEALLRYREAESILRTLNDSEILSKVLNNIGSVCVALSQPAQALEAFGECLVLAERNADKGLAARLMGNIADVYLYVGDTEISLDWSRKAVKQHRQNGDMLGVGITLANMGRVLLSQGDIAGALAVCTESHTVMTSINDTVGAARSMIALSELYFRKRQFAHAATFASDALEVLREANEVDRALRCMLILTRIAIEQKNLAEAQRLLRQSRSMAQVTDNKPLHIEIERIASEVAQSAKDDKKTVKHLLLALSLAEKSNIHATRAEIAGRLSGVSERIGNLSDALKFERLRAAAQQQADDELRARHGQALSLRLEMERAERERLTEQHQAQRLSIDLESKERELSALGLAISQKIELLGSIADDLRRAIDAPAPARGPMLHSLLARVQTSKQAGGDWWLFQEQIKSVHHDFIRILSERYPNLTSLELKLASLLKIGMSSKDISEMMGVTPATADVYRHRLRKKLGIKGASLTVFFQSLGQ